MRHLDANLVFSPRHQPNFQQSLVFRLSQCLVVQFRPLSLGTPITRSTDHVDTMGAIVFQQPIGQVSVSLRRPTFDDRPIRLANRATSELFVQSAGRLGGLRQNDDARDLGVQATDNTQIHVTRFLVFVFQIMSRKLAQADLMRERSLAHDTSRFVNDQQVVILVNNVQRFFHGNAVRFRPSRTMPRSLILASQSPRRKQLLRDAGYEVSVCPPDDSVEASLAPTGSPEEDVLQAARAKARAIAPKFESGIVLAADTIAVCDGRRLGKPRDRHHAEEILRWLSGREHDVITGVVMIRRPDDMTIEHLERTRLRMDALSEQQLQEYLDSGLWEGKAGAFGYQDRIGWLRVIDGSESNVVGLPMETIARMLEQLDDDVARESTN